MLIVVALGGNALLQRGQRLDAATQRRNVAAAAQAIASIAADDAVVVTHGNGPQVGLLALQALAYRDVPAYPLDVLGAESEGMIGYMIEQELRNHLPGREVATLLTMAAVCADDPAFNAPTKPIGPIYTPEEAGRIEREHGWRFRPDGGGVRRIVPSPEPVRILEIEGIRTLVRAGVVTICAGGGGIPVVQGGDGGLEGVEAVVDKDLSAALLAQALSADRLLMLTDVAAVYAGWGGPDAEALRMTTPAMLRGMEFEPGTMAPKVEAACRFVEGTDGEAAIGALAEIRAVLAGKAGTIICNAAAGERNKPGSGST
jgi:carbamate kinase